MSSISAKLVKELRERTGVGMMECKKALIATSGDIEKAIEEMRILGQAKADKKASRVAAEGVIEVFVAEGRAVLLEINTETDFVARDESFKTFAKKIVKAAHAANAKTVENVLLTKLSNGETIEEARKSLITKIGENIQIRRIKTIEAGTLGIYVHSDKIGSVVALKGGDEVLAKDIAMHVAAVNPMVISKEDLSAEVVAKEKEILIAQSEGTGKPANIIDKMVEGGVRKFLDKVVLLNQSFVKDPAIKIEKLLKVNSAEVIDFIRLSVGEGIDKKEEDFAAEVANQIKS